MITVSYHGMNLHRTVGNFRRADICRAFIGAFQDMGSDD